MIKLLLLSEINLQYAILQHFVGKGGFFNLQLTVTQ